MKNLIIKTATILLCFTTNIVAQLQRVDNGINIPGSYNFEQLNLMQIGNGNCALEFVNHTSHESSYGIRLMTNVDHGGSGLQIQTSNPVNDYSTLQLNYSTRLFIDLTGNVGIGTMTPASNIHIKGQSNAYLTIEKPSSDSEAGIEFRNNGTPMFYIYSNDNSDALNIQARGLYGEDDSNPRMQFPKSNKNINMVLSGGNVGIGTVEPLDKLHISKGNLLLQNPYDANYPILWIKNQNGSYNTRLDYNGIITSGGSYYVRATNLILNDQTGNVLIGKATQSNANYKLDVAGPIRANEVVVNTTGADFVFDKNYKLRPLAEVESFINANQHLPEVPSAVQMQTEGVGVSEMQTKLLQKVEEMTLYIISQQKQIEELKQQNQEIQLLKKEIEKLKTTSK